MMPQDGPRPGPVDWLCINTIRTHAGASAPLKDVLKQFGFTAERVVAEAPTWRPGWRL